MALGLKRRTLAGTAMALAGGWLVYRGVGGQSRRSSRPSAATGDRREAESATSETEVTRSITVGKPADELYDLWRDPQNLTQIVGEFAEVTALGEDRLHWTVDGPLGWSPSWDAQIVEGRPGESLRWESLEGTGLPNGASVRFRPAPGDRGTEVTLSLHFDPPGGALGDAVVNRLGVVPSTLASSALRRFKSLAETGEIPTLERNPSGRGKGDYV